MRKEIVSLLLLSIFFNVLIKDTHSRATKRRAISNKFRKSILQRITAFNHHRRRRHSKRQADVPSDTPSANYYETPGSYSDHGYGIPTDTGGYGGGGGYTDYGSSYGDSTGSSGSNSGNVGLSSESADYSFPEQIRYTSLSDPSSTDTPVRASDFSSSSDSSNDYPSYGSSGGYGTSSGGSPYGNSGYGGASQYGSPYGGTSGSYPYSGSSSGSSTGSNQTPYQPAYSPIRK